MLPAHKKAPTHDKQNFFHNYLPLCGKGVWVHSPHKCLKDQGFFLKAKNP